MTPTSTIVMPDTIEEACRALHDTPSLVPIAGGTDLLVHWPERLDAHDRDYLDLSGIETLRGIRVTDDAFEFGALATYWETIRHPAVGSELPILVDAARTVGAIQIQSRGTWAGNIGNASPAADGVAALMACDASVHLASTRGTTVTSLDTYFTGYKTSTRQPDELITAISIPRRAYERQVFEKVGAREAQTIAKVGIAITQRGGDWRIVASSVAATTVRCRATEAAVAQGIPSTPDDLLAPLGQDVQPIDDIRSTGAYRLRVLAHIIHSAITS